MSSGETSINTVAPHSPRNIILCEHPTKSPGPRVWPVPKDPIEKSRWNPVWLHLKGCPRGVCRGHGERFLPFVSVDLDRHGGEVLAKDHCQAVLATSRLLKKDFGYLTWLVEVNPKNGSTKFFGFAGRPIPVDQETQLSEKIHGSLIANGIGKREVFPFNSPQVFLPMGRARSPSSIPASFEHLEVAGAIATGSGNVSRRIVRWRSSNGFNGQGSSTTAPSKGW